VVSAPKFCMPFSCLPIALHISPRLFHPHSFYHPNYRCRSVEVMQLLHMQFLHFPTISSASVQYRFYRNHVLGHFQLPFFYVESTTNKMQRFLDLFIFINCSTCFRRFLRPSSGAQNGTYSVRYCQTNTAAIVDGMERSFISSTIAALLV
jgi:hypothetical protein